MLGERKIILSCLFIELKDEVVFLCLCDFNCCSKGIACSYDKQNATLNNFEEYYIY